MFGYGGTNVLTAEEWVRWYFARRGDTARALDLLDSRGIVYAKTCGSDSRKSRKARGVSEGVCHSKKKHRTDAGGYVCARCGDPWRFNIRFLLRGVVQTSARHDHFEHQIARRVDVGTAMARLTEDSDLLRRKEGLLYIASVMGMPVRRLAEFAPQKWPELPPPWGRTEISGAILRGRNLWIEALARIEIEAH